MANIQGQKKWSDVRLLETHELARGGVNGNLNEQAKALADRTEFLNQEKASKYEIVQGVFEFGTYVEFNAAKATLPANCTVVIGEENTTGTGTWGIGNNRWNGTTLTKSAFDPVERAKVYTDNKIDFVSGLPENNRFIKELYVTGWNGTDEIYLQYFNGNDNGKVTFVFKNKTASRDVIYTYQKAQGLQIYPLETSGAAAGSGFGGYIVVDWNAYSAAINAQGAYIYKVSKKALSLVNCPFIKEYIDVSPLVTSISTNTNDISALKQVDAALFSRLDFVTGLPENNQFIKELYITGWNGTDEIFLQYFTNNDGGLVTFVFRDKTNSRDVIYTYKKALGLSIYPLETSGAAVGSGFGGYVVVDWNAYTGQISTGNNYVHQVSRKALNLVNCPFIKEYLDTNSINASISAHTADINVLKEVNAKSTTLSSAAAHAQAANLNNFIKSIKLKEGHTSGFSYFIDSIVQTATTAIINIKYYNPENPSQANPWAANNITLTKGVSAIETYEVRKDAYRWLITLDWNYKPSANVTGGTLASLPINMTRLFEMDIIDLQASQPNAYKVRNDIKDGQSKLASFLSGATFTANGDTAYTQSVTQVADGTRVVLANTNANVNRRFRYSFYPFYVRMKDTYFMYMKYTINAVSSPSNSMIATISRSGRTAVSTSFFDNVVAGKTYEEVRKLTGDPAGETSNEGSLFIDFWSASNSPAGTVLDITIHDIRLLANYNQDPVFLNKERKEIEQLVRAVGYFESEIVIPKFVDTALQQQNINKGLEMQSLGDSTSAMVMWQERLAQMKGWHFNRTMAISGLNGKYPLALGGSWCEPIVSNFGAVGASGKNHYTRSSSIADYGIDVLFVLSSYNGQHIGKAWQTGGQLVKSDHGINDEPYHGGEVNLITNPTADFPSFGASYYGMLEKIMTANPNMRIVLLTLYLFNDTISNLDNIKIKNAVIRKAAEKYNLQLIDLEKISGINSFTAPTLCFDGGVHINQKGGDRLAQVIGGLV